MRHKPEQTGDPAEASCPLTVSRMFLKRNKSPVSSSVYKKKCDVNGESQRRREAVSQNRDGNYFLCFPLMQKHDLCTANT